MKLKQEHSLKTNYSQMFLNSSSYLFALLSFTNQTCRQRRCFMHLNMKPSGIIQIRDKQFLLVVIVVNSNPILYQKDLSFHLLQQLTLKLSQFLHPSTISITKSQPQLPASLLVTTTVLFPHDKYIWSKLPHISTSSRLSGNCQCCLF